MPDTLEDNFEKNLFYDGQVALIYDPKLHAYYVEEGEGERYLVPGATTICGMIDKSGPLTQWAANMTVQYLRENLTVEHLQNDPIPENPTEDTPPWDSATRLDNLFNEARFNFRKISDTAKDTGH